MQNVAVIGFFRLRARLAADDLFEESASGARVITVNRPNRHRAPYRFAHYIVIVRHRYRLYYYEHGKLVRDFAVARSVEIEPGAGLTVFTGETGAGKSLIVDALAFVFGARRGREVVASGAERCCVAGCTAAGASGVGVGIATSGRGRTSTMVSAIVVFPPA